MSSVTDRWKAELAAVQEELAKASLETLGLDALEGARVAFLGRSGRLTGLLKGLKDFSVEEKREFGPAAQTLKAALEERINRRAAQLQDEAEARASSAAGIDVTLPGFVPARGRLHPLTQTLEEMTGALSLMGFSWAEGPLVEDDRHNFTALNIPEHHSARDMHDTFYLAGLPLLLRTHTSPVQIRAMEEQGAPLRVMAPGRVFRHEQVDATHSAVFHQVEGLAIDEGITFADLKGTLELFLRRLFGAKTKLRFRPSYFPFTEPSSEVDVSCLFCQAKGCAVCKKSGWIELLGAGVVHPNVLRAVALDPARWSGFAFGIGVERVAMLRLGVPDIRAFYENDLRLLKQFDESLV